MTDWWFIWNVVKILVQLIDVSDFKVAHCGSTIAFLRESMMILFFLKVQNRRVIYKTKVRF